MDTSLFGVDEMLQNAQSRETNGHISHNTVYKFVSVDRRHKYTQQRIFFTRKTGKNVNPALQQMQKVKMKLTIL